MITTGAAELQQAAGILQQDARGQDEDNADDKQRHDHQHGIGVQELLHTDGSHTPSKIKDRIPSLWRGTRSHPPTKTQA